MFVAVRVVQADPEALYTEMNEIQADTLKSNNIVSVDCLLQTSVTEYRMSRQTTHYRRIIIYSVCPYSPPLGYRSILLSLS